MCVHGVSHYASWGASAGLASKLHAVVCGCSQYDDQFGCVQSLGIVIMGVFIASFAGTTLDTSTRLQRYMITELGNSLNIRFSTISATLLVCVCVCLLAFVCVWHRAGALQLWPLFGALNQLLASIGLGLITLYVLKTRPRFVMVSAIPFLFMLVMTLWATIHNQWQFLCVCVWLLLSINSLVLFVCVCCMCVWSSVYQRDMLVN